jgi:hypothetical protein
MKHLLLESRHLLPHFLLLALRPTIIIIIINILLITLTCNADTWNGVMKSSSHIYCCHGRVALSKAYKYSRPVLSEWGLGLGGWGFKV